VTDTAGAPGDAVGIEPQRARLRMRGKKRQSSMPALRKNAAILSMVDLLSCAFGGGLFLFMLTAAPSELANAAPPSATSFAFLRITLTSNAARPLVVLQRADRGDDPILIDDARWAGNSSRRLVDDPHAGGARPKVWTIGATPWDVLPPGTLQRPLLLQLEAPIGDWCIRFGLSDNDEHARTPSGASIDAVKVAIYQAEGTGYASVDTAAFQPLSTVAEPGAIPRLASACIPISFVAPTDAVPAT